VIDSDLLQPGSRQAHFAKVRSIRNELDEARRPPARRRSAHRPCARAASALERAELMTIEGEDLCAGRVLG
jgi:hypothetical protein